MIKWPIIGITMGAPSDIAPEIIIKVHLWDKTLQEFVKNPEVISKLGNIGLLPFYHTAKATTEMVKAEIQEVNALWGLK